MTKFWTMQFWDEFLKVIISNGIFAILFVFLFFWQLKDSQKREEAYRSTIANLTLHLSKMEKMQDDIDEIKQYLEAKDNERQDKIL